MTLTKSLRGRLILLLSIVALPAMFLSLSWVLDEDTALAHDKKAVAYRAAEIVSQNLAQLAVLTPDHLALIAMAESDGQRQHLCNVLVSEAVKIEKSYLQAAVYRNGALTCAAGRPGVHVAPPHLSWADLAGATLPQSSAMVASSDHDGSAILVTRFASGTLTPGWMGFATIDNQSLDGAVASALSIGMYAVAVFDAAGHLIVERRGDRADPSWQPKDRAKSLKGMEPLVFQSSDGQGRLRQYLVLKSAQTGTVILLGTDPETPIKIYSGFLRYRTAEILAITLFTLIFAVRLNDRFFLRWIVVLRDLALLHSRAQSPARFGHRRGAPAEIAGLGAALDSMADNAMRQTAYLEAVSLEKLRFLEELHHRVGNNFQVIDSLLSLQKNALPSIHREDIRFIEEHLRAVAAAHRLSLTSEAAMRANLSQLIRDVVNGLRLSAELPPNTIAFTLSAQSIAIDVDRSISLSLYLVAVVPLYLNAIKENGGQLMIRCDAVEEGVAIGFSGVSPQQEAAPYIREKLMRAYLKQLDGMRGTPENSLDMVVIIPLHDSAAKSIGLKSASAAPSHP